MSDQKIVDGLRMFISGAELQSLMQTEATKLDAKANTPATATMIDEWQRESLRGQARTLRFMAEYLDVTAVYSLSRHDVTDLGYSWPPF